MNYYRPASAKAAKEQPQKSQGDNIIYDAELARALYSRLNAMLCPYVERVVDNYDYNGSPIYSEDGISRATLSELVLRVLDCAAEELDDIDEIRLEVSAREVSADGGWNRNTLLNAVTESLVLNDIFMHRRPIKRRICLYYNIDDGSYKGIR